MKAALFRFMSVLALIQLFTACLYSMESAVISSQSTDTVSKRVTKADLLALISPDLQSDLPTMTVARESLDRVYEAQARFIKRFNQFQYGSVFNLNPEMLADIMTSCQNKKVLEIGAACGENALMIGLAGAEEVCVNDINPLELAEFTKAVKQLPKAVQSKFQTVQGDCLQVFNDAKFSQKFDIIYARNIFHYFIGEKREQFITLVHRLLKPGGRLILVVNTAMVPDFKAAMKDQPEAYVFKKRMPMLRLPGGNRILLADVAVEPAVDTVDPLAFHFTPVLRFSRKGFLLPAEHFLLSEENQEKVLEFAKEAVKLNGLEALVADGTPIDCHICHDLAYTRHTIRKPFIEKDFVFVQALSLDQYGHVTDSEEQERRLAVIFQKPDAVVACRRADNEAVCGSCGTASETLKKCGKCKSVGYCDVMCQKKHWALHKLICKAAELK